MKTDAQNYVKKSDKCQRFADVARASPIELTTLTSPWPFVVLGIDLIESLQTGKRGVKYAIVVVDFFTK